MNAAKKFTDNVILPASAHMEAAEAVREIATSLWRLRMTRKLRPETVANAVNISLQLLHKIESGRYNFTLDILFRLCEYYKADPDKVFLGNKEMVRR